MTKPTPENTDTGVLTVLIERFERQRLPRILDLKKKVDAGGTLDQWDTAFLEEVYAEAEQIKPLIDRHPEYHDLYAKVVSLYAELASEALENAQGSTRI